MTRHDAPIFFFRVQSAITIGAGGIGAPIVLADYKEDDWFHAHTNFHTNRLLIELYKQETEIRCRKDDGFIKKQTDIDHHGPVQL